MTAAVDSVNNFAINLFKEIVSSSDENVFFSPSSIVSAFSMLYAGACGETANEMKNVLCHGNATSDEVHKSFQALTSALNKQDAQYVLRNANKIYTHSNFQIEDTFTSTMKNSYAAEAESVNFETSAEEVRQAVNAWVEQRTENKIKDLLAPNTLNALTRLVLVNAVYFKGNWNEQFKKENTKDDIFHVDKNNSVPVKMMFQDKKFRMCYDRELSMQALEIPYIGNELVFTILLPTQHGGIENVQKALSSQWLTDLSAKMKEVKLNLYLPRFKMTETYKLENILPNMGMKQVFSAGMSDLSGISSSAGKQLFVSSATHKAFIEVNEEGTEAAAATAIGVMLMSLPPEVRCDRPFLFFIREVSTNSILFLGKVARPSEE